MARPLRGAMSPDARPRRVLVEVLRWVAALAALLAVTLLFREPLGYTLLPEPDRSLSGPSVSRVASQEEAREDDPAGSPRAASEPSFQLGPAPGFQLRATSVPRGADLWVNGRLKSSLPVLGNVECRSGERVELEVRKEGYLTWRRVVGCREHGQLEITARLERR